MATKLGPYTLERKIGAGGMADVWLAQGPRGVCVLKCPHRHLCDNPEFVKMFLDEAALLAQLHHPGIAQIFDLGHIGGAYYLAMEYVPGFDLMTISLEHERHGELMGVELCARIVADAAAALHYAHEAKGQNGQPLNLIHRDVTPHNILLSRQGLVKLIDFGVAKATSTMHRTQAGFVKGKYPYMAPEQITGQQIDRRVDVYALGLVLYELLTNTRAIPGNTEVEQIDAARAGRIRPIEQLRPNIPVPIRQILGGCLHMDPAGRYPTALAVKEDLEKFLGLERQVVGQEDLLRLFRVVAADVGGEELSASGRPTEREQPVSGDGPVVLPSTPMPSGSVDELGYSSTLPSMKQPAIQLGSQAAPQVGQATPAPVPLSQPAQAPAPRALTGNEALEAPKSKAPLAIVGALALVVIGLVLALWQPWASPPVVEPVKDPVAAVDAGGEAVTAFVFPPEKSRDAGGEVEVDAGAAVAVEPAVDAGAAVAQPEPVDAGAAVVVRDPTPTPKDVRAAVVKVSSSLEADVLVDGKPWGKTPQELELTPGKHVIVVQNKAEKLKKAVTWVLKPGETRTLNVSNEKGTLHIDVVPFGKIIVDGQVRSAAPVSFLEVQLVEGPHTVECVLEDPGLPAPIKKKQTATVKANETVKVSVQMMGD